MYLILEVRKVKEYLAKQNICHRTKIPVAHYSCIKRRVRRKIPKLVDWSTAQINVTYWTVVKILIIELLINTLSTNCIIQRTQGK